MPCTPAALRAVSSSPAVSVKVTRSRVSAAASAEEALQLLPYQTFDLALLDHNLPGM
jgi:CheY-like chemotaxis protein